jgi:hypothetical protein
MLQTLQNYDSLKAQSILSELTNRVLPNATTEEVRIIEETDFEYNELWAEIRGKLKLSHDDNSHAAITKIQEFLSNEISKSVFAEVDQNVVKSRLGQKGQLSHDLYQFKFTDEFKDYEKLGIRRSVVLDAVKKPDQLQHLHPERFQDNPDKTESLFIKHFVSGNQRNNHTLLVRCSRNGFTLFISDSWQIYHSEVDISDAILPEHMLRAFVNVFGVDIRIGEKTNKFFWYEKFALNGKSVTDLIQPPNLPNFIAFFKIGEIGNEFVEILHGYSVNTDKYKANLRSHGIIVA